LAILIVYDDHHPAHTDGVDGVFDTRERRIFGRRERQRRRRLRFLTSDFRFLSSRLQISAVRLPTSFFLHGFGPVIVNAPSSTARSTYFPTMSHSRFTASWAWARCRFVCAIVNGTSCTSNRSDWRPATVRLIPSIAI